MVRGEQRVGAIITPEGHPEPVVYLGGELPPQPWTDEDGWQPADMPQGVVSEVVETDVVALSWHDGELVGYVATVWLDRSYRHLERFDLPVQQADVTSQVGCRVLEALTLRAPFTGSGGPLRTLNVVVDDISAFRAAGWQAVDWLDIRAKRLGATVRTEPLPRVRGIPPARGGRPKRGHHARLRGAQPRRPASAAP